MPNATQPYLFTRRTALRISRSGRGGPGGPGRPVRHAAILLAMLGCGGSGTADSWRVIEEYDATTGANTSTAEFALADGADSAMVGLSCVDGALHVSLYQKRAEEAEWLLPFNFLLGFADDTATHRYTKPDLGTAAFQDGVLGALEGGGHDAMRFRTQMGLIADDLAEFTVPLRGVRSALRRLRGCADRRR